MEKFCNDGLDKLKVAVDREFDKYDIRKRNYFDKDAFRQWCSADHTIKAQVGIDSVQIAVGFVNIEKPTVQYPTI